MILLLPISGHLLLLLAAVVFVCSVIFAIWYTIMQAREESQNVKEENPSTGKRVAMLFAVILIFASIAASIYAAIYGGGILGAIGIVVWMISSTIVAYTCSPLRIWSNKYQPGPGQGCGYILLLPVVAIFSLVSMLIIMLVSWIFGLAYVLKRLTKKVYLIIAASIMACIVLLVAGGIGLNVLSDIQEDKEIEYKNQLVEEASNQIVKAVENGDTKKIVFDDETIDAINYKYWGQEPIFSSDNVVETVRNKFQQSRRDENIDGMLDIFLFLSLNDVDNLYKVVSYSRDDLDLQPA